MSVFKYLQAVLLYMPDYVHESEGIEELMPWSDKMKKLCAINTPDRSSSHSILKDRLGSGIGNRMLYLWQ